MVKCTFNNCKETMARKYLEEHVTTTCQWRMLRCEHCGMQNPVCQQSVRSSLVTYILIIKSGRFVENSMMQAFFSFFLSHHLLYFLRRLPSSRAHSTQRSFLLSNQSSRPPPRELNIHHKKKLLQRRKRSQTGHTNLHCLNCSTHDKQPFWKITETKANSYINFLHLNSTYEKIGT